MALSSPPLNALKAFESAGRHGSFVVSGAELGVTPAAVSQLVRKLEVHLGKKLFQRFNNRIVLTDAGKALFAATSPAMTELTDAVARVSRSTTLHKLRLSVVPSLAECWLLHKVPAFLAAFPRVRVAVAIEETAPHDSFDVRLNYGRLPGEDLMQDELWRDEVQPFCAPGFLAQNGGRITFNSALAGQLIHTQWGANFASNASWRDWFHAHAPSVHIDMGKGHDVDASRSALQLAEHGVGVALGQKLMARQHVLQGKLVAASPHSLPLGQSYIVATPLARERKADVRAFRTWLLSQVRDPAEDLAQHHTAIPTH